MLAYEKSYNHENKAQINTNFPRKHPFPLFILVT